MSEDGLKLTAVVDSNIFVSGAIRKQGPPYELIRAWRDRRFEIVTSLEQIEELSDVLQRPKIREKYDLEERYLSGLLEELHLFTKLAAVGVELSIEVRDPDDAVILAAAIAGGADYLVTGDNDLLTLAGDPRLGDLKIVTARAFLDLL